MPGTVVETYTNPGPSELLFALGATYYVAGLTERGDATEAVLVSSLPDFVDKFGSWVSYGSVYDSVAAYFAEGGVRAYVARVVGDSATTGELTLVDRAGTPLDTLTVAAKDPGSWSTRIKVKVDDGSVTNTFKITVLLDDEVAEVYNNLATPAAAVFALQSSTLVTATDESSATAAPNNNPAVLAATALSAGSDDRGSLVAADHVAALDRFTAEMGSGRVAIPGFPASQVGAGIRAHVATKPGRIGLVAPPAAQTVAQAKAAALEHLGTSNSEYVGLFYPWVKVPDGAGGTRTVSPEGYVAGVSARSHIQEGPWRAPAGEIAIARHVRGVETELTAAQIDDLNEENVNPIRTLAGTVRLYGWRSLSADTVNYRLLTGRDVMNEVSAIGVRKLERFVFGTVDGRGHFQRQIEDEMRAILEPMRTAGGLYERTNPETGDLIDIGYTVDAGPGVNTPDRLARDEVAVDVALRVSPTAELIRLRITKVSFQTAL